MAYIYVISNAINEKVYVGKTLQSIETRFKEHQKESLRKRAEKRPLYNAINKYGFSNFSVSLLEECDYKIVNEREKFWIEELNSYKQGYNATSGGDGASYYDYVAIGEKYVELERNQKATAEYFKCDITVVRNACKELNIEIRSSGDMSREKLSKKVVMYSTKGIFICNFSSMMDAADWIKENDLSIATKTTIVGHISEVCKGKRKSAYKHIWKYA